MADYIAILKKAISGVENATPEVRQQVYEKARLTITNKIKAIQPAPTQAAVDRQMAMLEAAISDVEAEYTLSDATGVAPAAFAPRSGSDATAAPDLPKAGMGAMSDASPQDAPRGDTIPTPPPTRPRRGERSSGGGRMMATLGALVVFAAAAYGAYTYRDEIGGMLDGSGDIPAETAVQSGDSDEDTAGAQSSDASGDQDTAQDASTSDGDAAAEADGDATQPVDTAESAGDTPPEPKLTQRLLPDGSEVDEGPAGGEASVGEGTSVAAVTQQPDATEESDTGAAPADALPVGQKAIFYEERTSSEEGSAIPGAVVWSVSQESPGNEQPPEPAIQAEVTIPEMELSLRMIIRRNGDATLPASHIIELVFATPENFSGGAIDQVQRVTFKSTEQAPGNPLVALPAKIADGYFLVALNDAASALQTNLTLLRREPWIDIPVTYKTGRRALITMEKGIPGDKVFDEVLKAWEGVAAANNG